MSDLLQWVSLIVAIIAGITAIITALIQRGSAKRRHREPTWENLVARVTELEEKVREIDRLRRSQMGAVLRILAAIARQWPDSRGPDLDPRDIELIEETIPPQWVRRPKSPARGSG